MPIRAHIPDGAPCWADLWTSDVEGSRRFYAELLGWEAQEPSPEFGGYFMFTLHGAPIAGGMGDMGDVKADNAWKPYFSTDDIDRAAKQAEALGATLSSPPMPVADLGMQTVLVDPTGAPVGMWQPGTFAGFTHEGERGTPSWFELSTRDHPTAVAFYGSVFGLETGVVDDSDDLRYTVLRARQGGSDVAGIMDAGRLLAETEAPSWSVYWHADDVDATVARALELGGSVVAPAVDTPYGRMAGLADPAGARFKLRTPNA